MTVAESTPRIYAIYNSPLDYPGHYVVRVWNVKEGRPDPGPCRVCETLTEARSTIPDGLVNIGRFQGDDPKIEECWL